MKNYKLIYKKLLKEIEQELENCENLLIQAKKKKI